MSLALIVTAPRPKRCYAPFDLSRKGRVTFSPHGRRARRHARFVMDTSHPSQAAEQLAHWLLSLMQEPQTTPTGELLAKEEHLRLFQQLPDCIKALIQGQEGTIYAPLLYHLIGCSSCHHVYLELYDAMRAALQLTSVPENDEPRT